MQAGVGGDVVGVGGGCWEASLTLQSIYFLKATTKTILILVEGDQGWWMGGEGVWKQESDKIIWLNQNRFGQGAPNTLLDY